jgi:uncharacterized protein (TIGR03437 family)
MYKIGFVVACAASVVFAQPSINKGGVLNAASYAPGIAQGSLFVVFGKGLGPINLALAQALPLTTGLANTSIKITANGTAADAYIYYTSFGQLAAVLPSAIPIGPADLTVTYNGQTSAAEHIQIVKSNPGVFTINRGGSGPASAQLFKSPSDSGFLSLTNSAQPGQTLVLYGTGLGAISGPDNDAPGAIPVNANITVYVNGTPLKPAYAGRAPQYPGLDQINVQLPNSFSGPAGCYTPATVGSGGVPGNSFTISTADSGSICKHPLGLDSAALAKLDAGQHVTMGLFVLLPGLSFLGIPVDAAAGAFFETDANGVFVASGLGAFNQPAITVAPGTCVVYDHQMSPSDAAIPNLDLSSLGREILAGDTLTLSGPGGKQMMLAHQANGGYLATSFSPILDAGNWTLTGSGGGIGSFSASITLPRRLAWTNAQQNGAQITRGDTTVTWTGAGADDLVGITGASTLLDSGTGKQFNCSFPASAGKALIPASIVNQLPPAPASGNYLGSLGIATGGGTTFTVPGKIDIGAITYGMGDTKLIAWR